MMAALFAVREGVSVHLFDQNEKLGKKLFITGKGRCNFTNACGQDEMLANVVTNPRFLYSAFNSWNSADTIRFFEELGVRTKIERGNRAFPASDHSSDIIRALEQALRSRGVVIHLRSKVTQICTETADDRDTQSEAAPQKKTGGVRRTVTGVRLENGSFIRGDAVVLATGGLSYPSTGSTGDGYRFAVGEGHTLKPCRPALVPLETGESWAAELQGLSLRNVTLTIPYGKKKKYQEFGEMLFTHFGISGPLVLSASSVIGRALEEGPLSAWIDLKPALSDEQLDARILREFEQSPNRSFQNAAGSLFPSRLRPVMVKLSGIDGDKPVREVTREERALFLALIRRLPLTITGLRSYREAVITQGGIHVKEVDPSTMESKLVRGLYICGEVLDLDAMTGGFNLQIAWATGHAAGCAAGQACQGDGPFVQNGQKR